VSFGVPVISELDLCAAVAWSCEKYQRVTPLRPVDPAQLLKPELIDIEVEGLAEIGHSDHRMQILHGFASRVGATLATDRTPAQRKSGFPGRTPAQKGVSGLYFNRCGKRRGKAAPIRISAT